MSEFTMILTEQDDRVLTITLNRPDDLNPLSWQVLNEIDSVLDRARHDDSVGVIVIGAAGKAFSTGYDLREAHWITSLNTLPTSMIMSISGKTEMMCALLSITG